jgi:hypothetical protein
MKTFSASHYPGVPKNKVWDMVDGVKLANGKGFASTAYEGKAGFAVRKATLQPWRRRRRMS